MSIASLVSRASNGIKLASIDSSIRLPQSAVAVVLGAGPRYESNDVPGAAHFLKSTVLRTVPKQSNFKTVRETELAGATLQSALTREHIIVSSEFLRDSLPDQLAPLLTHTLNTFYHAHEFVDARELVAAETLANLQVPTTAALDAAHQVAFRRGLGNSLFATEEQVANLTRKHVQELLTNAITNGNVAIVGVGVKHTDLESIAESIFKDLPLPPSSSTSPAQLSPTKYFGGEHRISGTPDSSVAVLAFNGVSFTSSDYAVSLVLKHVLGGIPSSKWGSPSGVSTLLSKVSTASTSTTPFSSSYSDGGLFGFLVNGEASELKSVLQGSVDAFKKVADGVSEEALKRAKKAALVELDSRSRLQLVEDAAQSTLKKGAIPEIDIGKVTSDNVSKLAKCILSSKPSFVTHGNNRVLPYLDELKI